MGYIILFIGASGTGKDSLMRYVQQKAERRLNLVFPKRWITRRHPDDNEPYIAVSEAEFFRLQRENKFIFHWQTYGYYYGIETGIIHSLAQGKQVVLNVSRSVVRDIRRRFPRTFVIMLSAPIDVISARIRKRARNQDQDELRLRVERAKNLADFGDYDIRVDSRGPLNYVGDLIIKAMEKVLFQNRVDVD